MSFLEIDLDEVFVEAGLGFGPPGFETEPPPVARQPLGYSYSQRLPLRGGRHEPFPEDRPWSPPSERRD